MNLKEFCLQIRKDIIQEIGTFGVGHIGGSLSIVEILAVLYNNYMNFDPNDPQKEGRDRISPGKLIANRNLPQSADWSKYKG